MRPSGAGATDPVGVALGGVVAGVPSSLSRARSSRPNPAAATREASRMTPARRAAESRGSCGSFGPIARARAYTSGTSRSSSERKRSCMSVIGLLQEWSQTFPRLCEMHADRRLAAAEDAGDVAGRQVGVLVQGDRGALVRAQGGERSDQIRYRFRHLVAGIGHLTRATVPRLQLPCRDPEGRPPDPSIVIANGSAAAERLGECFGHRVGRYVGVGGEGDERSPELGALLPPYPLDTAPA